MLLDSSSKGMSDELMSKAKSSDFELFIDFKCLNKVFLEDFHIRMHVIDRKCATTNENGISLNKLLNCRDLLK